MLERAVAASTFARSAGSDWTVAKGTAPRSSWRRPGLPFLPQSAEILDAAPTRPKVPLYPRVSLQLQTTLDAALTGRLAPRGRGPPARPS